MRRTQGFVFLIVLMFMQIFSLLGLYGLQNVAEVMKRTEYEWQREKYRLMANQIMKQIEATILLERPSCLIDVISAAGLSQKTQAWWEKHACQGDFKGTSYYYTIEFITKDPCAIMRTAEHAPAIASYYRLSFYLQTPKLKWAHFILQSTIAVPTNVDAICEGKLHEVYAGPQMRLEI